MLVTTEAIVIASIKYSEADLIVKCFTQSDGLKSYLLRGVLKSKRGKLRPALFQPLTLLHLEAVHKNKGTLERLKEAKISHPLKTLYQDFLKTAIVFFIADVLRYAIQEEEQYLVLFEYIKTAIIWLDTHTEVSNFHLLFLLRLTQYLGFHPDSTSQELPFFNILDGAFEPTLVNTYCYDGPQVTTLKQLLGIKFDDLNNVKLNQSQRTDFLTMLLAYYELHLHGFKKPKSLSVLNSIFS